MLLITTGKQPPHWGKSKCEGTCTRAHEPIPLHTWPHEHSAHNACTQKSTRSASTKPTLIMVSIRDPHLGPGLSRTHTKLTSEHGTISAPRPCVNMLRQRAPFPSSVLLNARKTRTWALTTGATATCNDTQAFARTSRSSRYRSWDLALHSAALQPTQTNYGDTAAVKSSYLSAQRHRNANTTWVSTCLDPLRGLTCCCCCCSCSNPPAMPYTA